MTTCFEIDKEPTPWSIVGDQILNANGSCVIIFDPDDQSGLWQFIVAAVNLHGTPANTLSQFDMAAVKLETTPEKDPLPELIFLMKA
jgi:hypothetical protein